ncbi:MAG: hypothetical protein HUJ70_13895 [Pseudobutyrivibrio sp.]|nr:hypothetical protein [Pseudobutyrivibrio sp.]
MKDSRRLMCIILTAASVSGLLTACGKDGDADAAFEAVDVMDAEVAEVSAALETQTAEVSAALDAGSETKNYTENATTGIDGIASGKFAGNKFYYVSEDKDMTYNTMCSYDMTTEEKVAFNTVKSKSDDASEVCTYILDFIVEADGSITELMEEGCRNPETGEFTCSDTAKLVTYDKSGKVINTVNLGELKTGEFLNAAAKDSEGNIYLAYSDQDKDTLKMTCTIKVLDKNGSEKIGKAIPIGAGRVRLETAGDGTVKLVGPDEDDKWRVYDLNAKEAVSGEGKVVGDAYNGYALKDGNTVVYVDEKSVKTMDLSSGESASVADLSKYAEMKGMEVWKCGVLEDGTYAGLLVNGMAQMSGADAKALVIKFN